jgi:hypothetical protein
MIEWIFLILLVFLIIWIYYYKDNQDDKRQYFNLRHIQSNVLGEQQYMPMDFPQVEVQLVNLGIPKATIQENKPIIEANIAKINELNKKSLEQKQKDPNSNPAVFGVNTNIIYTEEEFYSKNTGYFDDGSKIAPSAPRTSINGIVVNKNQIPALVDINTLPMYNQDRCGCCWVVSACNVLNYKWSAANNKLAYPGFYNSCLDQYVRNAYQNPRSVADAQNAKGCNGGLPNYVLQGVYDAKSLVAINNIDGNKYTVRPEFKISDCNNISSANITSNSYPIKGFIGLRLKPIQSGASLLCELAVSSNYFDPEQVTKDKMGQIINPMKANPELVDQIKYALAVNGPMAIAIAAQKSNLNSYSNANISLLKDQPDHAVVLVGYEGDHWKIQNSWGGQFGQNGYFYAAIADTYFTGITGLIFDGSPFLSLI